jgi:type I restriction-modification system DNA methylase subunit
MRHFATESGKSKGQFYTPAEVSRIMAKVIGISRTNTKASTTAYDPTCGSGSLLLKVAAEAGRHITLEGQERDVTTAGLARMNMILHDFPTANILSGNTLSDPKFKDGEKLRTYDYVVANPPFSDKTWSTGLVSQKDRFQRFAWGVPPIKQGDYAYLLHIIRSMKGTGKAACILPQQCRSGHSQGACPLGISQGHHRSSGEFVFRHRHTGLHCGSRQGERHGPQGHFHDRRFQGLHERRAEEPAPRAGYSPHR